MDNTHIEQQVYMATGAKVVYIEKELGFGTSMWVEHDVGGDYKQQVFLLIETGVHYDPTAWTHCGTMTMTTKTQESKIVL